LLGLEGGRAVGEEGNMVSSKEKNLADVKPTLRLHGFVQICHFTDRKNLNGKTMPRNKREEAQRVPKSGKKAMTKKHEASGPAGCGEKNRTDQVHK